MTNQTDTPDVQKRDAAVVAAIGDTAARFLRSPVKRESIDLAARTVEMAFSSEALVERSWGYEILDHGPGACDLSILNDSAPVLLDHDFSSLVGVIENARIDGDRIGRAITRFGKSTSADEALQDVADGIRKHVSVQYRIKDAIHDGEHNGMPVVRVTRWQPFEVTLTAIPADRSVGVGRSQQITEQEPQPSAIPAQISEKRNAQMTDQIDETTIEKRGADRALAKVNDILALGEKFATAGGKDIAARALREGKDESWVREEIMSALASRSAASTAAPDLGLTDKEVRRFSLMTLVRAMAAAAKGERKAWEGAGFERECHDALVKRYGDAPNGGIFVPYEVQKRDNVGRRDLTVAGSGGYLVATEQRPSDFIGMLRANSVLVAAGARMLSGLKGNVEIPKQSGASTAYLIGAEDDEITESNLTFGQLALSPKTLGVYVEISRLLQMQSDPSVDMLVMDDMAKQMALKIDLLGINGNGAGGPVGIINTSGIGSVTGTSLDYAKAIEFQTDVATANALVPGCKYITTPAKAAICAQRQRFSSTDTPLWTGNVLEGNMLGFGAMTTTQISDGMIFGDFSQLIMAEWGVLELAIDPTANFKAGITGMRAFQSFDIGVRHAGAFSYASSIT